MAVQTMTMVLNKSCDEYLALLNYRHTPLYHGYYPAQLSMAVGNYVLESPVTRMSWSQRPLTVITSEEKIVSTEQKWNSIMTRDTGPKWTSQKEPEDDTKSSWWKTSSLTPECGLWELRTNMNERDEPRRSLGSWSQPRRLRRTACPWEPTSSKWALMALDPEELLEDRKKQC